MSAYAVTDVTTGSFDSKTDVTAALETALQAVDSAKTVYYIDIIELPVQKQWAGVIIHAA